MQFTLSEQCLIHMDTVHLVWTVPRWIIFTCLQTWEAAEHETPFQVIIHIGPTWKTVKFFVIKHHVYTVSFKSRSYRVNKHPLSRFWKGLNNDLRRKIMLRGVSTLDTVYTIVQNYDLATKNKKPVTTFICFDATCYLPTFICFVWDIHGPISITIYPQLNRGHSGTFGTLTIISSK